MLYRSDVKTASTVIGYSQKFGRIARGGKDKPVILNVDESGKVSIAMCESCLGRGIPDCNEVMAETIYDPITNKPAVFSCDVDILTRGFVMPEATYLQIQGRAVRHSLNDGNRDSRWSGVFRKSKIFMREICLDFAEFSRSVPSAVLVWLGGVTALFSVALIIIRSMPQ